MSNRFFINPIATEICQISGESAHHIVNVMRMKTGDSVILFDGTNREFTGIITETDKKVVTISIQSVIDVSREQKITSTVAVAFPKGDRQKFMIEKLVELGVDSLVPLQTQRSVVNVQPRSLEKIQRWIVEASKQCGRNQLMQIKPAVSFNDWIHGQREGPRFVAHPHDMRLTITDAIGQAQKAGAVSLTVGPEGGFTSQEIADAQNAGWSTIALGITILRIETAAIAAATFFSLPENPG